MCRERRTGFRPEPFAPTTAKNSARLSRRSEATTAACAALRRPSSAIREGRSEIAADASSTMIPVKSPQTCRSTRSSSPDPKHPQATDVEPVRWTCLRTAARNRPNINAPAIGGRRPARPRSPPPTRNSAVTTSQTMIGLAGPPSATMNCRNGRGLRAFSAALDTTSPPMNHVATPMIEDPNEVTRASPYRACRNGH